MFLVRVREQAQQQGSAGAFDAANAGIETPGPRSNNQKKLKRAAIDIRQIAPIVKIRLLIFVPPLVA